MNKTWNFIKNKIRREDKIHLLILLVVILTAVLIRIYYLFQPIRYDEAATFILFVSPEGVGLFNYLAPNNHVFHTLLVYLSYLFFW